MKQCIICRSRLSDKAEVCEQCGFPVRRHFLSETHYRTWMRESAIPYREQWNERQEKKTDQTNAVTPKPKKKPYGLIAAGAAVVVLIAGIAIGFSAGGKQSENLSASQPEQTADVGSAPSAQTADAGSELSEQTEPEFDLDLFCNLPLTSRDEAIEWLYQNGYSYKEGAGSTEDYWSLDITVENAPPVSVFYRGEITGSQGYSQLSYDYNSEAENDAELQHWLSEQLSQRYDGGRDMEYYGGSYGTDYFEEAEEYSANSDAAYRVLNLESSMDQIVSQVNQIMPLLTAVPDPAEKQETLTLLDENGIEYENDEEHGWCSVSYGDWDVTYHYEAPKLWNDTPCWRFYYCAGNPQDYYKALKSQMEEAGYQAEAETENEYYGNDITYSYEGRQDVKLRLNMIDHVINIYIGVE